MKKYIDHWELDFKVQTLFTELVFDYDVNFDNGYPDSSIFSSWVILDYDTEEHITIKYYGEEDETSNDVLLPPIIKQLIYKNYISSDDEIYIEGDSIAYIVYQLKDDKPILKIMVC